MKRYLLTVLVTAVTLSSQDVKIYHVDLQLTIRAKLAWRNLKDAEISWNALRDEARRVYLHDEKGQTWQGLDFNFSEDFTVIIPSSSPLFSRGDHRSMPDAYAPLTPDMLQDESVKRWYKEQVKQLQSVEQLQVPPTKEKETGGK